MNCPNDATPLDLADNQTNSLEYVCSLCGGKFSYSHHNQSIHNPFVYNTATLPKPPEDGKYYRCPKDNDMLMNVNNELQCQTCQGVWTPGVKPAVPIKQKVNGMAVQFMSLLVIGIGLFSWQAGSFSSSASGITAVSQAPTRALVMVAWFATFMLLFTVPMSIYMQMVQAHRPHFRKAISHPVVTWIPVVVVILMALNVYFLTP